MKEDIRNLLELNKNLIYKIASPFKNNYDIEDLYQVGVIGLIKAYKNYKNDKQTKFSTYAYTYIWGEIMEFIRQDRNMKVTPENLKIYKCYKKTKEFLYQKSGVVPTIHEISLFLNIDEKIIENSIIACDYIVSLDNFVDEEKESSYYNVVGYNNSEIIDSTIDLKSEIEKLTPEEQALINYRYYKDYSQTETASELGMSQVQVSRKEALVLSKIRKNITL